MWEMWSVCSEEAERQINESKHTCLHSERNENSSHREILSHHVGKKPGSIKVLRLEKSQRNRLIEIHYSTHQSKFWSNFREPFGNIL